jgi:hypothetical protein
MSAWGKDGLVRIWLEYVFMVVAATRKIWPGKILRRRAFVLLEIILRSKYLGEVGNVVFLGLRQEIPRLVQFMQ